MVNNVMMRLALTSPTSVSNVTMPPPLPNYSMFSRPSTSKQTLNGTISFSPATNENLLIHCPSTVTMSLLSNSNATMSPSPNLNVIMTSSPATNEFSYTQDQDNLYVSQFLIFPNN